MAIERFRRSATSRIGQLPTIQPIAAREAARSAQRFSQAMDRVSRFAFGQAQEQYESEAETKALEIVREKGAVPAVREIVEQGGPQDLVEETVYEVGNRIAAVRIGSMAKQSMNQLVQDAEQNKTSFEELDRQIDDVVLGFTSALEEYSAEAALEARLELESDATTYKNNYAQIFQDRQLEELQGEALAAYESERQSYIAAAIEDVPPEVREQNLLEHRERIEQLFIDAGYSQKDYQPTLIELDQEAKESQIMMDFNNLESIQEQQDYLDNLRENPVPELGVDGTRVLRNKLRGELGRAQSDREAVVATAEDRLDGLLRLARTGGEVSQEELDQIATLSNQYPELRPIYERQNALIKNVQSFRRMPPSSLEAAINEMRSEGFDTEFEAEMIELAETTLSNMESAASRDPISAYIEYAGADAPVAFQIGSVEEMQQSIEQRIEVGNKAAQFFGVEPKYLTDAEANELSSYISQLNPSEKAQVALGMNAMPPQVWAQVADKEQGLFAMTSAIGDPLIANNVFEGQTLIRDKLVEMPTPTQQLAIVNDTLGSVYGEADRKDIISAARAYYAATVEDRNFFDSTAFEEALQKITGGVAEINGQKTQIPRDMDADAFDRLLNNFTAEMVEYAGGVQGMTNEEAAELIRDLPVESEGGNLYFPKQAGQTIMHSNGEPFGFVVDDRLRAMANRRFVETSPGRTRSRVAEEQRGEQEDQMPNNERSAEFRTRSGARRAARSELMP